MSLREMMTRITAALLVRHAVVDRGDHSQLTIDELLEEAEGLVKEICQRSKRMESGDWK